MNRGPFARMGGKYYLTDWIISFFTPHDVYLEPFVGSCAILLNKSRARVEIINDIDGDLVNFLLIARRDTKRLMQELEQIPYSRLVHDEFKRRMRERKYNNDFERAVMWFYLVNSSFNSLAYGSFATGVTASTATEYLTNVKLIECLARRLQGVIIEQLDYREFLTRYLIWPDTNGLRTLVYCDPPYLLDDIDASRVYYMQGAFGLREHEELASILNGQSDAKILVSHYDDERIHKMYPPDKWNYYKRVVYKHSVAISGTPEKREHVRAIRNNSRSVELLIMNYKNTDIFSSVI